MSIKKIQCLDELFTKLDCRVEVLQFLKDEKLITDDVMASTLNEIHTSHSSRVFTILNELQNNDNVQLIDYEWTILPKQFIRLTIVTDRTKKDFTYTV